MITKQGLEKAKRVRRYIENLTFTKGKWAGQPFRLQTWQWEKVIKPAFGTLKKNGMRQYRIVYVEIPKKNGKTELGAGIALYMLSGDGEKSPEVYSAAADREQASLIYMPAAYMVRHNKTLSKRILVRDSKKRLIYPPNNGFYQVLSAEVRTKHGINPSCILFDEIHAQPDDELWRVLTAETDIAREQQLIFIFTTAGVYDKNSIWWRLREKARQIEAGIIKDDSFLPILYIADPEKDFPEDENLWRRVNPSIGRIFDLARIRKNFETAKNDPVEYQDFLRYRLNIPIKQLSRWMPMDKWDKCGKEMIDIASLDGRPCYGGLDLSSKIDLAAFILEFPPVKEGEKYVILCRFYCPEEGILKRSKTDKVHYNIWAKQKFLTATSGNVIDEQFIEKDIIAASEKYDLKEVGYDPWGATAFATRLFNDNGIKMVEMRQGAKTLSEPAKDLLVKTMKGELSHGGHPVLRWNADNLVMTADANANIRPDKDKATEKIDGMVALIMAHGRAMFCEDTKSVYEERGVITI